MSLQPVFSDINPQPRVRRARYICDTLREMISSGQLNPGDRLPTEEDLCKHFKVSRTTLREAIQMLRFSGLLKVSPGRGSFVQEPDMSRLMSDVSLYSRSMGNITEEIQSMLFNLLESSIKESLKAPLKNRRELFDYVLNRSDEPEQAEQREASWLGALASIGNQKLAPMMVEMLLSMKRSERKDRFSDQDEIMRTIQTQIRLNTAIVDGEEDVALRLLGVYLAPMQKQSAAGNTSQMGMKSVAAL